VRILVVEDEPTIARAVRKGLEQEGYAADVAGDGTDALSRATESAYDAILLDVMIPKGDGFEVCRELRARRVWTPVLMLTARGEVADRIRGLDVGADDYLAKPFDFGELLARLRSLLRRAPAERPAVLQAGDLELDPAHHTVTRSREPIELSAREFALLEFLMRHAGEVVSRTAILEHVWDYAFVGLSNVVDVYVSYLRKKLGEPPGGPVIRTVRGVGYALDPGPVRQEAAAGVGSEPA